MKKFICILLTLVMAATFFACTKEAEKTDETSTRIADNQPSAENNSEKQTVISCDGNNPEADNQLCSVPLAPTGTDDLMLQAAYRAMSKEFEGATVKNHEVLRLGKIGDKPCVRVRFETDKGEFIAVVNEDCDVVDTWSEGEEKTMQYWFPQLWDLSNASDVSLSIAFHAFHGGGYHDDAIIYDYRQTQEIRDGKWVSKVVFYTTHCTSTFWIDEAGRIIDRTK